MDFYEQKKKQQNVFGNGAGNPSEPDVSFDFDQHLDQMKYEKTVEDIQVQIDMMNLQAEVDQEEKEEQRAKMIENRQRYKKELKEHKTAILKIRAKLMAIPVAILVGIGLFSAVRAALHGKGNEIVDVEAEEVSDDVDETYEDDAPVEE